MSKLTENFQRAENSCKEGDQDECSDSVREELMKLTPQERQSFANHMNARSTHDTNLPNLEIEDDNSVVLKFDGQFGESQKKSLDPTFYEKYVKEPIESVVNTFSDAANDTKDAIGKNPEILIGTDGMAGNAAKELKYRSLRLEP
jgi:hypothetical protein